MPLNVGQRRSKALFGNMHMLAIAATVADLELDVRARHIEQVLCLSPSTVHRALASLVNAELLTRLPRNANEREQVYRRKPHAFWNAVRDMGAESRPKDLE